MAAANREGTVEVIASQGSDLATALTRGFQAAYPNIQVDLSQMNGAQAGPKIVTQVGAGQGLTDVALLGSTSAIQTLMPANALDPLQQYLVGPESKTQQVWSGGAFTFADDAGQYILIPSLYVQSPFYYNPDLFSPDGFTSRQGLLDPQWKGKIAMLNPLAGGGGSGQSTFWYATPSLGKPFIQQFFTQQSPDVFDDDQTILDGLAHGKYAIAIGPSDTLATQFINEGLPVRPFATSTLPEGDFTTAGGGNVVVPKNPPHPNATKVYIDYLLSEEGQAALVNATGFASLRQDVPHDNVADYLIPKPGVHYIPISSEQYVKLTPEVVAFLKTVMT